MTTDCSISTVVELLELEPHQPSRSDQNGDGCLRLAALRIPAFALGHRIRPHILHAPQGLGLAFGAHLSSLGYHCTGLAWMTPGPANFTSCSLRHSKLLCRNSKKKSWAKDTCQGKLESRNYMATCDSRKIKRASHAHMHDMATTAVTTTAT